MGPASKVGGSMVKELTKTNIRFGQSVLSSHMLKMRACSTRTGRVHGLQVLVLQFGLCVRRLLSHDVLRTPLRTRAYLNTTLRFLRARSTSSRGTALALAR